MKVIYSEGQERDLALEAKVAEVKIKLEAIEARNQAHIDRIMALDVPLERKLLYIASFAHMDGVRDGLKNSLGLITKSLDSIS